jgi:kynurenine formamidase
MKLHLDTSSYINTDNPLDISIPMIASKENLSAWYVTPPVIEPVRANGFLGSVKEGGSVNFRNIFFNPHGHGTHTECLGHITEEVYSVNDSLKKFICKAQVISINPELSWNEKDGQEDAVIYAKHFEKLSDEIEAIIIRTSPNDVSKTHKNYSATNPAYIHLDVLPLLEKHGVKHLLIDLPSVDRENDGGALSFHHGFWKVPENPQFDKTITELIYVPDSIEDGIYILDIQMAPFVNDASPSRPVLYKIFQND